MDFDVMQIGINDPHFIDTRASIYSAFFVSIPGRSGRRQDFNDQIGRTLRTLIHQDVSIFVAHVVEIGLKNIDLVEENVGRGNDNFAIWMIFQISFNKVVESARDFLMKKYDPDNMPFFGEAFGSVLLRPTAKFET